MKTGTMFPCRSCKAFNVKGAPNKEALGGEAGDPCSRLARQFSALAGSVDTTVRNAGPRPLS